MERATWQSAVFKVNLNDDRENAARSSASYAQVLRGVALMPGFRSWEIPTGHRWKKSRNSRNCFSALAIIRADGTTGRKGESLFRPHPNQIHQSPAA
jgi:hypothetical protein